MKLCDVCGKPQRASEGKVVSPQEMRRIAENGFGKQLKMAAELSPEEKGAKFYELAVINDTPWAVCEDCYKATRPYDREPKGDGLSAEEFHKLALGPVLKAAAASAARQGKKQDTGEEKKDKPERLLGWVATGLACLIYIGVYCAFPDSLPGFGLAAMFYIYLLSCLIEGGLKMLKEKRLKKQAAEREAANA